MDPLAPKVEVDIYGITDVGRKRKQNEDNFLLADLQNQRRGVSCVEDTWKLGGRGMLFAVCDGMGGAAAGEVASQMAVDTLHEKLRDVEPGMEPPAFAGLLDIAIQTANRRIFKRAQKEKNKRGMGTTVSAAAILGNVVFLAQVGDSRAYLFRDNKLQRITKDQSLLERLIEEGQISPEHAKNFSGKNVILQALGPAPQVLVDLKFLPIQNGDVILLCSDGLHDPVEDKKIELVLQRSSSLEETGRRLIDVANNHGGPDNITTVLLHLTGEDLPDKVEAEAIPQAVKYVRAPVDTLTLHFEKQLGLVHWLNKYLFAWPMLVLYGLLFVGGLFYAGHGLWKIQLKKKKSTSLSVPTQNGRLVVTSDVQPANLYVDKVEVGELVRGGISFSLPSGKYKIYIKSKGWRSKDKEIDLHSNEDLLVELNRGNIKKKVTREREWLPGQDP